MAKHGKLDFHDMEEGPYRASRLMKTLGNPKAYALARLLLREKELSVEEICSKLNRTQPGVSQMLRALRDLEVVRYQRKGHQVIYTFKDAKALADLLDSAENYIERTKSQG